MLCQKCHKNLATVRYAEVVNGKVTDLHLCAECLAKHQENATAGFELTGSIASRAGGGTRAEKTTRQRRACKSCGTQLVSITDTGRVGCAGCYSMFAEDIEPVIAGIHGNVHHLGKNPTVTDSRANLRATLQTKRALLRAAVRNEQYEDAAALRDSIQSIEKELGLSEQD